MSADFKITSLPSADRPRERLILQGAAALSNSELLAILLRTGGKQRNAMSLGQEVLMLAGSLAGLQKLSHPELCALPDMGSSKAAVLLAAVELGKRISKTASPYGVSFSSPEIVANFMREEMKALEQEKLVSLVVDMRNRLIRKHDVYLGSLHTSVVRVGEVFREAVRANAAGIIVIHNHPSGDPSPSPEDIQVTRNLVEAGRLLDIRVLDHVIIGGNRYVSLRERGLGFEALRVDP